MVSVEPLKRLTVSSNREDRLAMERMLKGAVVMGGFFTETAQPDGVEYSLTNVDTNAIQAASDSDKTIASLNQKKSDDAQ